MLLIVVNTAVIVAVIVAVAALVAVEEVVEWANCRELTLLVVTVFHRGVHHRLSLRFRTCHANRSIRWWRNCRKNGILAKGGGEAFQEASPLDLVVFDKTSTLTDSGKPAVTDYEHLQTPHQTQIDEKLV
jgi:hypothetical protein